MIHELKIAPRYFQAVAIGIKTFEVRLKDRPYQVGDRLLLKEFSPNIGYTGRTCLVMVTYILSEQPYVLDEYCIMATKLILAP